jgi:hypothetical protein
LQTTGKVFAKGGLLCTQFQRKTEPEQKFFPFANLQISLEKGKFFASIFTKRSKNSFNPAFWQTLVELNLR